MTLDSIQRALEDYLDRKRFSFPRFYFLSNEEMFDMLSNLRDINAVQPLLKKCFAGLYKLIFGGKQGFHIVSMQSWEGETVDLSAGLRARGPVEEWLTIVEVDMVKTLKRLLVL